MSRGNLWGGQGQERGKMETKGPSNKEKAAHHLSMKSTLRKATTGQNNMEKAAHHLSMKSTLRKSRNGTVSTPNPKIPKPLGGNAAWKTKTNRTRLSQEGGPMRPERCGRSPLTEPTVLYI